jgi:hypothetical protein
MTKSAPHHGRNEPSSEEKLALKDETMEEVAGRSASARDGSAEGKRGPGRPRKDANSAASAPLHAPHNGGAAERCPACKGRLEKLGTNRLQQPIQRCVSCHREFGRAGDGDVVRAPAASAVTASSAAPATSPGRPCSIDGCPGIVRGSAPCDCCERRARFLEQYMPKRSCEICGGTIRGRGMIKYCKPCKPIAAKVQIANAPSNADPKKKKGAAAT